MRRAQDWAITALSAAALAIASWALLRVVALGEAQAAGLERDAGMQRQLEEIRAENIKAHDEIKRAVERLSPGRP